MIIEFVLKISNVKYTIELQILDETAKVEWLLTLIHQYKICDIITTPMNLVFSFS